MSQHRLQRLALWARLTLVWLAGLVLNISKTDAQRAGLRRTLAHQRALIGAMLVLRAGALVRGSQNSTRAPTRSTPAAMLRAGLGGAFRRAARHRDPRQEIAHLLNILASPDHWIAHFARRLRRGFTRRAPITARPMRVAACDMSGARFETPAPADSS